MISCPKCGKENQDHYKFCLGCGNELPRDGGGQRPFRPTPPAVAIAELTRRAPAMGPPVGALPPSPFNPPAAPPFNAPPLNAPPGPSPYGDVPPMASPGAVPGPSPFGGPPPAAPPFLAPVVPPVAPMPAAPVAAALASGAFPTTCPQCGSPNPRNNRFCITCGFDMSNAVAAGIPGAAPPVASPDAVPPTGQSPARAPAVLERARLVLIRPDGSEGGTYSLHDGENAVGREAGGVFAQDMYLSPHHATFTIVGNAVTLRDEGSLNGVYVRVERQQPVDLRHGDVFRIGQEILRYDAFDPVRAEGDGTERLGAQVEGLAGKISLVVGRESHSNAFPIPVSGLYLGRERGDILFPEDGYVSGLHCQLNVTGGRVSLVDVGSSNGTYIRLLGARSLKSGDFLLIGQQLFRMNLV